MPRFIIDWLLITAVVVLVISVITLLKIQDVQQRATKIINLSPTCSSFSTSLEAENFVQKNHEFKNRLDHDHDGKICESLP